MGRPLVVRVVTGLALIAAGCDQPSALESPSPAPLADAASQFDPLTTGTVSGRVVWAGELPIVEPFRAPMSLFPNIRAAAHACGRARHAPGIDSHSRGVAGAVVFLRGIDPRRARPWDHPPVTVELRDYTIHIIHDKIDRTTGIVRRGDAVEFRSNEDVLDTLQARGDAFFALPLPLHAGPCRRTIGQCGVVELMSGAGHFWMRGHLFVDDHPYYTWTDAEGRFTLAKVPPGDCEVVCWHPNWHEAAHERDADTGHFCRLTFRPAVVIARPITVPSNGTAEASFSLSDRLFSR